MAWPAIVSPLKQIPTDVDLSSVLTFQQYKKLGRVLWDKTPKTGQAETIAVARLFFIRELDKYIKTGTKILPAVIVALECSGDKLVSDVLTSVKLEMRVFDIVTEIVTLVIEPELLTTEFFSTRATNFAQLKILLTKSLLHSAAHLASLESMCRMYDYGGKMMAHYVASLNPRFEDKEIIQSLSKAIYYRNELISLHGFSNGFVCSVLGFLPLALWAVTACNHLTLINLSWQAHCEEP